VRPGYKRFNTARHGPKPRLGRQGLDKVWVQPGLAPRRSAREPPSGRRTGCARPRCAACAGNACEGRQPAAVRHRIASTDRATPGSLCQYVIPSHPSIRLGLLKLSAVVVQIAQHILHVMHAASSNVRTGEDKQIHPGSRRRLAVVRRCIHKARIGPHPPDCQRGTARARSSNPYNPRPRRMTPSPNRPRSASTARCAAPPAATRNHGKPPPPAPAAIPAKRRHHHSRNPLLPLPPGEGRGEGSRKDHRPAMPAKLVPVSPPTMRAALPPPFPEAKASKQQPALACSRCAPAGARSPSPPKATAKPPPARRCCRRAGSSRSACPTHR